MRILQVAVFAASMLFLACAGSQPVRQETPMNIKFDADTHNPYMQKGKNTIKGQGFLRQQGGGVVTCAGEDVNLLPATPYFRELLIIYKSGKKPMGDIDPTYKTIRRQTKADAQGNFTFTDLPDGNWFVSTKVRWTVAGERQGGGLIQEVRVSNGETKQMLLTENDLVF